METGWCLCRRLTGTTPFRENCDVPQMTDVRPQWFA